MIIAEDKIGYFFGLLKLIQVVLQVCMLISIEQFILTYHQDVLATLKIITYIFLSFNIVFVMSYCWLGKSHFTAFYSEVLIFTVMILISIFVGIREIFGITEEKVAVNRDPNFLFWFLILYEPAILMFIEAVSCIAYYLFNVDCNVCVSRGNINKDSHEDDDNATALAVGLLQTEIPITIQNREREGIPLKANPSSGAEISREVNPSSRAGVSMEANPSSRAGLSMQAYPSSRARAYIQAYLSSRAGVSKQAYPSSRARVSMESNPSSKAVISMEAKPLTGAGISMELKPLSRAGVSMLAKPSSKAGIPMEGNPSSGAVISMEGNPSSGAGISMKNKTFTKPLERVDSAKEIEILSSIIPDDYVSI